jgi:hypothetical protein
MRHLRERHGREAYLAKGGFLDATVEGRISMGEEVDAAIRIEKVSH